MLEGFGDVPLAHNLTKSLGPVSKIKCNHIPSLPRTTGKRFLAPATTLDLESIV